MKISVIVIFTYFFVHVKSMRSETNCYSDNFENGESNLFDKECGQTYEPFIVRTYSESDDFTKPEGSNKYLTVKKTEGGCMIKEEFYVLSGMSFVMRLIAYFDGTGTAPRCFVEITEFETNSWINSSTIEFEKGNKEWKDWPVYVSKDTNINIRLDCAPVPGNSILAIDSIRITADNQDDCDSVILPTTEGISTSTQDIPTTENTVPTTEATSSTEDSSSTTDMISSTDDSSSTTEEISTTEIPTSTTEEISTTEDSQSTTEEISTTEDSQSTTEDIATTEDSQSTTEEISTTEDSQSTTEENSTTEEVSTTENTTNEALSTSTTEETTTEFFSSSTEALVSTEENTEGSSTTEEQITSEITSTSESSTTDIVDTTDDPVSTTEITETTTLPNYDVYMNRSLLYAMISITVVNLTWLSAVTIYYLARPTRVSVNNIKMESDSIRIPRIEIEKIRDFDNKQFVVDIE